MPVVRVELRHPRNGSPVTNEPVIVRYASPVFDAAGAVIAKTSKLNTNRQGFADFDIDVAADLDPAGVQFSVRWAGLTGAIYATMPGTTPPHHDSTLDYDYWLLPEIADPGQLPDVDLVVGVQSVTGTGVDNTDPRNPVITNAGGNVASVFGRTGAVLASAGDYSAFYDTLGAAATAQAAAIAASQPLDADLTAIAALTTTTYGRALLTQADAAATRTTLGLGTAATQATGAFDAAGAAAAAQAASQPLDSDLTAIAALATTSFGRSFLALADAAAGRTLLGLGTLATQSGTFSGTSSGTNTGDQDLSALAPKASPALTGVPTAPTASAGTNTTQVATTAFVGTAVAAAAGGTALGWIDVTASPYSADKTGASDATSAVQAAITAAVTAGGGTVYFPAGMYLMSSATTSGTSGGGSYTGQVLFPARDGTVGPIAVRLLGATPSPLSLATDATFSMPVEAGGSIIKSTATSGNAFSVIPAASNLGDLNGVFSNITVHVENLIIRCPNNPQVGGLDLSKALSATVTRCTVGVNSAPNSITSPTGTAVGIQMPGNNNSACAVIRDSEVYGFPVGIQHAECAYLDNAQVYRNLVGISVVNGYHGSVYNRVITSDNVAHIAPATSSGSPKPTIFGTIDTQVNPTSGSWWITKATIDDLNAQLQGSLKYCEIATGTGVSPSIMANGALALGLSNASVDGYSSLRPVACRDSFTRPNTAWVLGAADSAQTWMPWVGVWGITSNKAYNVSGANETLATLKTINANPTITVNVTTGTVGKTNAGIACCVLSASNHFAAVLQDDGGGNRVRLYKKIAGTLSVAADAVFAVAASTTYALEVDVTATTITVKVNGATQITYTLSGGEQTTFAGALNHGLWCYRSGVNDTGLTRWASFAAV